MPKGVKYGKWTTESMERAIAAYKNGDMGLNEVCRQYGVPKATLKRHMEGKNFFAVDGKQLIGSLGDIPPEIERELVDHVLKLEETFFGITSKDLRELAFQVVERNNMPHRFNRVKKCAGKKWYYNFMRRHPELSLRLPENTSIARASGFSKERVIKFFEILESLVDKYNLDGTKIFNMDESGLPTVQKRPQKILAKKGKSQVGTISSGERGVMTTAVCCVSAGGFYVPPMLIYKRGRACDEFKDGAPPGTVFVFNPESSYINKEIFNKWMEHFISNVKPSKLDPVLLLCDGHSSHTKNIEAIEMARENGVIMLALPSHTSAKLQPLDVAFFKPLSTYFTVEIEKYLRSHPDRIGVKVSRVADLFGKAYGRAATLATAISAFKASGLWPVNKDVFQDHHFAPSLVYETSNPRPTEGSLDEIQEATGAAETPTTDRPTTKVSSRPTSDTTIQQPSTSRPTSKVVGTSTLSVPLTEISPLPRAAAIIQKRKGSVRQDAQVLTLSPYKSQLEESIKKRKPRSLNFKSEPRAKKIKKEKVASWYCDICDEDLEQDMIQCMNCRKWVHEQCAGAKKGQKKYYCRPIGCKQTKK